MDQQSSDRFVQIETLCAHLQHDVDQMHQVLLAMQNDMKSLRLQLERLQSRLSDLQPDEPDKIDPLAERPPHY